AALEYAVTQLMVDHVVVMGHAQCGGIASLVGISTPRPLPEHSFIRSWMSAAEGAFLRTRAQHPEADPQSLGRACEQESIRQSLDNLMTFPWVAERVKAGNLGIHGWYFDMTNEALLALDQVTSKFEVLG
ncbi:MAG: carbonic anhydrase, partial [Novosphingobium sp.]